MTLGVSLCAISVAMLGFETTRLHVWTPVILLAVLIFAVGWVETERAARWRRIEQRRRDRRAA